MLLRARRARLRIVLRAASASARSEPAAEGPVEDGGEQRVQLGGGLHVQALQLPSAGLHIVQMRHYASLLWQQGKRNGRLLQLAHVQRGLRQSTRGPSKTLLRSVRLEGSGQIISFDIRTWYDSTYRSRNIGPRSGRRGDTNFPYAAHYGYKDFSTLNNCP